MYSILYTIQKVNYTVIILLQSHWDDVFFITKIATMRPELISLTNVTFAAYFIFIQDHYIFKSTKEQSLHHSFYVMLTCFQLLYCHYMRNY